MRNKLTELEKRRILEKLFGPVIIERQKRKAEFYSKIREHMDKLYEEFMAGGDPTIKKERKRIKKLEEYIGNQLTQDKNFDKD